jgi:alpha-glucosidase
MRIAATGSPADPNPTTVPDQQQALSIRISPELAQLPVFVRAGSILPIAPVVQSTDETPQGPLTLRVYVGDRCSGDLYQDDGKTYAYQRGVFLRMKFSCEKSIDGLRLKISPHEGSYPAWWKEIRAEIYGWTPKKGEIFVNAKKIPAHIDRELQSVGLTFVDSGYGAEVEVK